MKKSQLFLFAIAILLHTGLGAQKAIPKGTLFIIGGGDRPPSLVKSLLAVAQLNSKDYIVVLPMSSEEPDSSFHYFKEDFAPVCTNTIANLNFTKENVNNTLWLDSLVHAKLIFITGGDQERFMNVVLNTPVYSAIHKAYENGSTIAGTSAGAAVMSKQMITGKEFSDTVYRATFRKLHSKNIEIKEGLGLLTNAIIDQHFIVRSRYNRLLSALAKYPTLPCIGIDEVTAIVVHNNKVKVTGESQVIVFKDPKGLKITPGDLIKLSDMQVSIYTAGDEFLLK
ncbi:MAG: cyanophycinase [Bacteroidetes bacterium]|nr:cyanophycinase [Bacteroidota bacterium]MBS1608708.1 cyanophycinase [Bacteroidota bacterium]